MQDVNATTHGLLTLARGPVIYCVEDVDNVWVQDHFKVGQFHVPSQFCRLTWVSDSEHRSGYTRHATQRLQR